MVGWIACLIHPGIGEEQSRVVVGDCGRRWDIGMAFGLEEGEKFLADLGGSPLGRGHGRDSE